MLHLGDITKMSGERYKVRAVASYLGCTPDLIYSYFKDRKDPVDGGLDERQMMEIYTHIHGKNRKRPFKNNLDDIKRVQMFFEQIPGEQLQVATE